LNKIEINDFSKTKNKPKIDIATYEENIDENNKVYLFEKLNPTNGYYRKRYIDLGLGGLILANVGTIYIENPVGLATLI